MAKVLPNGDIILISGRYPGSENLPTAIGVTGFLLKFKNQPQRVFQVVLHLPLSPYIHLPLSLFSPRPSLREHRARFRV